MTVTHAIQGHRYLLCGTVEVMALESGRCVEVAVIDHEKPWPLTDHKFVHASQLTPLPMRYFNGELPQ